MFKICSNCVIDSSDPNITFDEEGVCNHCRNFKTNIRPLLNNLRDRKFFLDREIDKLKTQNKNNEFDCIIGLSGGVDSSYMLHLAVKEYNLRPLVFHVDAGWNS